MARVPLLKREQLSPEGQRVYDQIAARRGNVPGPYQVLLHVPELAGRVGMVGQYIRFEGALPAAVRETAILAAARETNCNYEWSQHEPMARAAGVPDHVIAAIAERRGLDGLPPQERIPISLARECVRRHRVPDDLFAAARAAWGAPGVVELVTAIGYYTMLAILLNAVEVQPPPGTPRLPPG